MATLDARFAITVDREDQGKAAIHLWQMKSGDWTLRASATRGGWDDAIPWKAGIYDGAPRANSFSGFPAWHINENFTDREAILFHVGLAGAIKLPYSFGSYGCIVADGTFMNKVKAIVGSNDLDFVVRGADPKLGLTLTGSASSVSEGDKMKLKVNLTGDSTGISKDCYVLVKQTTVSGAKNGSSVDYKIDPKGADGIAGTADDFKSLYGQKNDAHPSKKTITEKMLFVKIAAGKTSAAISVSATPDKVTEGEEVVNFKIMDYYFDSPRKVGTHRYYSDYLSNPKVLIKNGGDRDQRIKIKDLADLDDLTISKSGGIEGFSGSYKARPAVNYTWGFDAYSIPDTIKIYDNTGIYVNVTNGSGYHSGSFALRSGSNGVIKIEVKGSASGTAWNLSVSSAAKAQLAMSKDGPAADADDYQALLAEANALGLFASDRDSADSSGIPDRISFIPADEGLIEPDLAFRALGTTAVMDWFGSL